MKDIFVNNENSFDNKYLIMKVFLIKMLMYILDTNHDDTEIYLYNFLHINIYLKYVLYHEVMKQEEQCVFSILKFKRTNNIKTDLNAFTIVSLIENNVYKTSNGKLNTKKFRKSELS